MNYKNYEDFLKTKIVSINEVGFHVDKDEINPILFPFQRDVAIWALRLGRAAIFADCGLGKGQPYGAKLLTPSGWVKNTDINVGDMVIASDGNPYSITGIFPKKEQKTYRFSFTDGASFVVDEDHLHIVKTFNDRSRGNSWRVLSTKELLELDNLKYGTEQKHHTYSIPLVSPVTFNETPEKYISSYVMGVLLGDGHLSGNIHISSADNDIIERVQKELPDGVIIEKVSSNSYDHKIKTGNTGNKRHKFRQELFNMGLLGTRSHTKFIPSEYLYSNDRIELLRGLMDTDGYIGKDGTSQFYSVSKQLADDVLELVRSLGGNPTMRIKKTSLNGEQMRDCYVITFSLRDFNPFYLKRKADRWNNSPRVYGRFIESIEPEEYQKTICISVDSPDSSYVTENYIVTHNTFMQLEWARIVAEKTKKPVLIVAPLGVTGQTIQEAKKLGVDLHYCRSQSEADGVTNNITNYEMLSKFNLKYYSGIVIDESSILKNYTGKTKKLIIEMAQSVEYRLACTATPAPNDHLELGNHAEFLGIMRSREMIQRWFVNDSMHAGGYRLRKHGASDFWQWVASWAVSIQKPSDIGNEYSNDGYILPALNFIGHIVAVDHSRAWQEVNKNGQASLLLVNNTSATGMHKEKRATLEKRMKEAANTVKNIQAKNPDEYIIVWCEYNYEADLLVKLLPDAIEIRGNEKLDVKQQKLLDFSNGKYQVLITKPKIAAHGLNWQHAGSQVWVSINHKFEQFYQGYKRSHRFGRHEAVDCHIVYAESEGGILSNLTRKHKEHEMMQHEMVRAMRENGMSVKVDRRLSLVSDWGEYETGDGWKLYHGDSAQTWQNEQNESIDFIVQSPPFKSLYIYSSNIEDLGNCATDDQFYYQYQFILKEELRLLKPGSYKAEHCKDLPLYQNRDGAMGLQDFPGELIKAHLEAGFEFVDWITIWKDPVVEMQRTKNAGLLWSSAFCERAERARQGMADYTLIFRKPDGNPINNSVNHTGLPESVVNRCIDLWSNANENIQSPFHKIRADELIDLMIVDNSSKVMPQIESIIHWLRPGRNLVVNIDNPLVMMDLINAVMPHGLVFHSRVAMTNGNWLLVFRRWVDEMAEEKNPDIIHVKHDLVANEHEFVGNSGPDFWDSDRGYSILVWQRYASPVWFDLDGLPNAHKNIWFDINQTNVLNHRIARDDGDEKHICPLQIDLIERCISLYTKKGQRVGSSFVGVGSELVAAIQMGREARGSELKQSYYELACQHLRQAVMDAKRPSLFDFAGVKV